MLKFCTNDIYSSRFNMALLNKSGYTKVFSFIQAAINEKKEYTQKR